MRIHTHRVPNSTITRASLVVPPLSSLLHASPPGSHALSPDPAFGQESACETGAGRVAASTACPECPCTRVMLSGPRRVERRQPGGRQEENLLLCSLLGVM